MMEQKTALLCGVKFQFYLLICQQIILVRRIVLMSIALSDVCACRLEIEWKVFLK